MPRPPLSFRLDPPDHRAFQSAVRHLQRVLGPSAPNYEQLVRHQLTHRDSPGLVDEYLDSIGWPPRSGRSSARRKRAAVARDPSLN
ncbi:MAG: hypothetical protein KF715_19650 [Candidatus Didemnitutus sp.]|nr:hypothetical protein [Candidatus Didemnitutus sp.]